MLQIILLGILAGSDNLQVAAAISMAPLTRARRAMFAAAFCTCEIVTPLAGLLLMHALQARLGTWIDRIAPLIVILCGVVILVLSFADRDELESLVNRRWTLAALPLSLSFDNLLIGVSLGAFGYPLPLAAAIVGSVSACMCLIGIAFGARIRRALPAHASAISGLYLIVFAVFMWK
jgi:putative Mn2+ efflux pump MntP